MVVSHFSVVEATTAGCRPRCQSLQMKFKRKECQSKLHPVSFKKGAGRFLAAVNEVSLVQKKKKGKDYRWAPSLQRFPVGQTYVHSTT